MSGDGQSSRNQWRSWDQLAPDEREEREKQADKLDETLRILGYDGPKIKGDWEEQLKGVVNNFLEDNFGVAGQMISNLLGLDGGVTRNLVSIRDVIRDLGHELDLAKDNPEISPVDVVQGLIDRGELVFDDPQAFMDKVRAAHENGFFEERWIDVSNRLANMSEDYGAKGVPLSYKVEESGKVDYGSTVEINAQTRNALGFAGEMAIYGIDFKGDYTDLGVTLRPDDIPDGATMSFVKDEEGYITAAFIDYGDGEGYYIMPDFNDIDANPGFFPNEIEPQHIAVLQTWFNPKDEFGMPGPSQFAGQKPDPDDQSVSVPLRPTGGRHMPDIDFNMPGMGGR